MAEAKMRNECGQVFIAKTIWTIGLPQLPEFLTHHWPSSATEQRCSTPLSAEHIEPILWAIQNIVDWLDRVAVAMHDRKLSPEYAEAVQRSGEAHQKSSLSATEQEIRKSNRKAKFDLVMAKRLAKRWREWDLTYKQCESWQFALLQEYWNGSLDNRVQQILSRDTGHRYRLDTPV